MIDQSRASFLRPPEQAHTAGPFSMQLARMILFCFFFETWYIYAHAYKYVYTLTHTSAYAYTLS
jgi:hypothetical protein